MEHDTGTVLVGDEPGGFGLENLAQRCNAAAESTWGDIINAHFKEILQGQVDRRALAVDDFEKVKSLLRVKLYDPALSPPGMLAGWPLAEDLFAALVYDLPTTISPVSAAEVQGWGKTVSEVFDLALSNVWAEPAPEVRELAGDAKLFALSGSTFFLATHVLIAGGYVPPHSRHGLIVACPTRDHVLVHPIGAAPLVQAMQRMSNAAHNLHAAGPWSITASLYWVREGTFERLAVERSADRTAFTPSEAFAEVLHELDGGTEEPTTADHASLARGVQPSKRRSRKRSRPSSSDRERIALDACLNDKHTAIPATRSPRSRRGIPGPSDPPPEGPKSCMTRVGGRRERG